MPSPRTRTGPGELPHTLPSSSETPGAPGQSQDTEEPGHPPFHINLQLELDGTVVLADLDAAAYPDWQHGVFRFDDEPLMEVAAELAAFYGI